MSVFVEQGTIAASAIVTLEPDRGGNFYCTGAADQVEINAAIVYVAAIGGGEVVLGPGGYALTATVNVPASVLLRGMGWTTILNYDAGGNCITFTGANAKLHDLKILIVADAGGAGTRPNGIFADGLVNLEVHGVWVYGDRTNGYDGSFLRNDGMVFDGACNYCRITNNIVENCGYSGIYNEGDWVIVSNNTLLNFGSKSLHWQSALANVLIGNTMRTGDEGGAKFTSCNATVVVGNLVDLNSNQGMELSNTDHMVITGNSVTSSGTIGIEVNNANNTILSGNSCYLNGTSGIKNNGSEYANIAGNQCNNNTEDGINLVNANYAQITGNLCTNNSDDGIWFAGTGTSISGNNCFSNNENGIMCGGGEQNIIIGNNCHSNVWNGISLLNTSPTSVIGNNCYLNDFANTATYSGIFVSNSDKCFISNNVCYQNDAYGIDINTSTCDNCWVKDNQLLENTGGPMNDAGTGTVFDTVPFQFTEAIVGAIVTTAPTGVDVDANTEGALAWGQIPSDVQQVMRLKLWGVATDAPIGAGGQMHLEIVFNAGASNAAYNEAGKSWTLANFDGEEADYVANDVVHWVVEDGDVGSELKAIVAGDSFEIFAMHEAGADPDGATDCLFRVVEVDYV